MAIAGAGRLAWPAEILSRSLMLMLVLVLMSTPGPEVCSRISKTATATFAAEALGGRRMGNKVCPQQPRDLAWEHSSTYSSARYPESYCSSFLSTRPVGRQREPALLGSAAEEMPAVADPSN
jgi:hypothetical protein